MEAVKLISIPVKASGAYEVLIGQGLLGQAGERLKKVLPKASKAVIVTDSQVEALYGETLRASLATAGIPSSLFAFPPGEHSKNGATYLRLLEHLAREGLTRSDVLLALGGGVTGDLTGFAAATYLRGIPYVQLPTSLLAMVDSSVGGKTAIDLEAGKNLAGAFYQPRLVLCDVETLDTLPEEELINGTAEVIKYGMLGSAGLLALLREPILEQREEIIARCVTMKRDIVEADEFDQGERQLLNFGHTFGHGIEKCSGYAIPHGSAVAIGMHLVTRAALTQGLCSAECLTVLDELLERHHLPKTTDYPAEALYEQALHDKKRAGGRMNLVVPESLGVCQLREIPVEELLDWAKKGRET